MKKNFLTNTKLGLFVLTGSGFLILLLYLIGKNKFMFGSNYMLKARFENVQGLKPGNNIRFSGIDIGTVRNIRIINDTTMEVDMVIGRRLKNIIRKNAIASIGTDGLVGNKVVNIMSTKTEAPFAEDNDVLSTRKPVDTDEMLRTLNRTGTDMADIAAGLKVTVKKINNSGTFWNLMGDEKAGTSIKKSLSNFEHSSISIRRAARDVSVITGNIRNGKGSIGKLITDTGFSMLAGETLTGIKNAGASIRDFGLRGDSTLAEISDFLLDEKGNLYAFNKDSMIVMKVKNTLENINHGTGDFNEIMEAMKHSFLFRGYFKKRKKEKTDDCQ